MKYKIKIIQISCDGGAATGKTTAAKMISKKYKLKFLSSGLLYRYASYLLMRNKSINKLSFLKKKFKDYKKNFQTIENFIKQEVEEIEKLQKNNSPIIPEINFRDLNEKTDLALIADIKKKGCLVVRDVFNDEQISEWNKDIEQYIDQNNYYELQKEKADLDKYFINLKAGKPQIFGLYWSRPDLMTTRVR